MLASSAIATPEPITPPGRFPFAGAAASFAGHLLVAAWVFAPALFAGRMLYFRDISTYFYPNLVFLGRSLAAGVFPLWNPSVDAGSPFLLVYPPDLLLVALAGPRVTLALAPALHMVLASLGAAALGRYLGLRALAAWTGGAVFALSGFMVSAVNLVPLQQAGAWAPVVVLLALQVARRPGASGVVLLAAALALQISTLAAEIVIQTGVAAAILLWRRCDGRGLAALAGVGTIALLLSAPAWLGVAAMIEGTRRAEGFSAAEALSGSLSPAELVSIVLPRFFGDMHTFTGSGFWGQEFFLGGFPYLLSVYLGAAMLALAVPAGRDRLWWLVALGVLLALGEYGPFSPVLGALAFSRTPVKFLFLASLGVALLAGRGLDRALDGRARWGALAPGIAVCVLAAGLWAAPDAVAGGLAAFPMLGDAGAQAVMRTTWPAAFLSSGVIALAVGVAAVRGGKVAGGAAALVVLDLLLVNGDVNRFAPGTFYALRPSSRALMNHVHLDEPARIFGYGLANTPGLRFAPSMLHENSDVWLYYLDRQVLFGRAPILDGFEGALDEDRTAWAPPGSTLHPAQREPHLFRAIYPAVRRANIRWILSFWPLPSDLVVERAGIAMPEVLDALRLWEVLDPLPRAFFTADPFVLEPGVAAPVEMTPDGPHAIRLHARTPPGFVILLSGWHPGWEARDGKGAAVPIQRTGERYMALPTPGGEQVFHLRYRPRWWRSSLLAASLGVLIAVVVLAAGLLPGKRRFLAPVP